MLMKVNMGTKYLIQTKILLSEGGILSVVQEEQADLLKQVPFMLDCE